MGRNKFPIGLKFNHLTIVEYLGSQGDKNRHTRYRCICDCGKTVDVLAQYIGKQKSCGCAPRNNNRYKSYNVSKEGNMKLVREGVFETNSSSTHSLTLCTESVYNDWKNGKLLYCEEEDKFYEVGSKELKDYFAKCVLMSRYQYNWETKSYDVDGKDLTEAELLSQENLDSISDKDIEEWKDDTIPYIPEIPSTYEEWTDYRGEDYELFEQSKDLGDITVIGFGYQGYD